MLSDLAELDSERVPRHPTPARNTDSTYGEADLPANVVGTRVYYDSYGRVVATRDANLIRDTIAYDLLNRVRYTAKGTRTITSFYNALALDSVSVNGQVTRYLSNALGWVTSETDPVGYAQSSTFDLNGNALTWTNRRGQTIGSTYDALNRPLSLTADGSTRTFFYDPTGRWSGAVRGAATDTIRTDIAGRDSVVITVRGSRVYTQRLGYGSTGQRTTHRLVAGGYDQTTAWGYTEDGQLKTLTPPGQLTATTLEYNADGLNTGRYAPGLAFTTGFSGVHAPSGLSYGVPALNR